jgi:hydroxymethylglutaryl-CoA reductase
LYIDCLEAMGANMVNTVAEAVADRLAELASARVGLRILSNLCDRRLVRVSCRVPFSTLKNEKTDRNSADSDGGALAREIEAASRFAEDDIYRAATHNKGIMNGVDPVVIATGNDWRGVEAGAHAFAARDGRYRPLATWRVEGDALVGRLAMPMALGTVGGTLQVHAGARLALRILGNPSARELAQIIGSVGLAQNLAALKALAGEGIQRGHMALHRRATGTAG